MTNTAHGITVTFNGIEIGQVTKYDLSSGVVLVDDTDLSHDRENNQSAGVVVCAGSVDCIGNAEYGILYTSGDLVLSGTKIKNYGACRCVEITDGAQVKGHRTMKYVFVATAVVILSGCPLHTIEDVQKIGHPELWEGEDSYPLDGNYIVMNDIDASATATWNDGAGFDPIGSVGDPFTGVIDGQGYEITDLVIDRPDMPIVGLIAWNQGIVGNLRVDGHVIALAAIGMLCGANEGMIQKCAVTGEVYAGSNGSAGGMVGGNLGGTIQDAWAQVDVVSLGAGAGGLVATNYSYGGRDAIIARCWSSGSVDGTLNVGGLVGAQGSTGATTEASYYDSETSGQSDDTGKGTPKTTEEMMTMETFFGWDFLDVWEINEGFDYPRLISTIPN